MADSATSAKVQNMNNYKVGVAIVTPAFSMSIETVPPFWGVSCSQSGYY